MAALAALAGLTAVQSPARRSGPYMLVWLAGASVAALDRAPLPRPRLGSGAVLGALLAVRLMVRRSFATGHPLLSAELDLLLGMLFALLLASLRHTPALRPPPWPALHRWLAGFSFSLYCTHIPVLSVTITALAGLHVSPWLGIGLAWLACLIVAWAFSQMTEAHTGTVRRWLGGQMRRQRPPGGAEAFGLAGIRLRLHRRRVLRAGHHPGLAIGARRGAPAAWIFGYRQLADPGSLGWRAGGAALRPPPAIPRRVAPSGALCRDHSAMLRLQYLVRPPAADFCAAACSLLSCVLFGMYLQQSFGLRGAIVMAGAAPSFSACCQSWCLSRRQASAGETALGYGDAMRGVFSQKNPMAECMLLGITCIVYQALEEGLGRRHIAALLVLLLCIVLGRSATSLGLAALVRACRRADGGPAAAQAGARAQVCRPLADAGDRRTCVGSAGADLAHARPRCVADGAGPALAAGADRHRRASAVRPRLCRVLERRFPRGAISLAARGWQAPDSHNGYLEVAVELGLAGLCAYLFLFVRVIRGALLARGGLREARLESCCSCWSTPC